MNAARLAAAFWVSWLLAGDVAAAEPELTRAQALQRLTHGDAGKRREAAERLGEVGVMSDAKALVEELRDADEDARAAAEEALWKIWARSGDEKVDVLYRRGLGEMATGRMKASIDTFTAIIGMRPAFAEAWNKRATAYFMVGEYQKSLADCDEVMKRNPYHFGALAGYFQIYVQLEKYERALGYGYRALEVNPNMDGVRQGIEAIEQMLGRKRQSI